MAQKRMFSKDVISNDNFIEMPDSSQNLYFHLSLDADDDGFVANYKSIMRMLGKKEDDLKVLIAKRFLIPFENGVLVIRHWKINNYIQKDRYKETIYKKEKALLSLDNSNVYNLDTNCIHSIDKIRLDKISIDKNCLAKPMLSECLESIEENSIVEKSIEQNSIYAEIIDYLNNKTNSNYRYDGKKTKDLIKARLNEGFNLEDFKQVIDNKVNSWGNDAKMVKFLRPETLFSNKFESYLNEKVALKKLDAIDQVFQEWKEKGEI